MDLQQKVMNAFIGKVVRKDLACLLYTSDAADE